ncbi:LPS export ABC transporter periplasmic protein LptC [Maridesulfovibrio sp.]|jgi:LPS export ABC transporter protein LptC|uniref:LPS export ABC transporter periplasmic protein LptC n=1 Tax=Maridesulfovibrio sp. TaxID=2795000 RepID=UPI0029CAA67F|nr:LPS export ABC transporter periplasmic protein LptC [Maridesulfovibrio sp.]
MGRLGLILNLILALFLGLCSGTLLGKKYGTFPHMARGVVESPLVANQNQSDISAEEIELIQGTGGDIEWVLRAGSADYDQEKGLVIADKPRVTYYLGRDRKEVFVSALHGEVSQKGHGLKLWDHVEGNYGDMGLVADRLDFKPKDNLLFLEGNVKVQSPSVYITSNRVKVDLITREIMIEDGMEALISPDMVVMPQ